MVGGGDSPVAHDNGYMVQRLGEGDSEIPVVLGATQVGASRDVVSGV